MDDQELISHSTDLPLLQAPRLVAHHWRNNPLCARTYAQYRFWFSMCWAFELLLVAVNCFMAVTGIPLLGRFHPDSDVLFWEFPLFLGLILLSLAAPISWLILAWRAYRRIIADTELKQLPIGLHDWLMGLMSPILRIRARVVIVETLIFLAIFAILFAAWLRDPGIQFDWRARQYLLRPLKSAIACLAMGYVGLGFFNLALRRVCFVLTRRILPHPGLLMIARPLLSWFLITIGTTGLMFLVDFFAPSYLDGGRSAAETQHWLDAFNILIATSTGAFLYSRLNEEDSTMFNGTFHSPE